MKNPDLWQRLSTFEIDVPDAELTFAQRLARENGWTTATARAAIGEYKRFLYLIAVTGEELTPSDGVDQVWHLHLVYTRSYWQSLCAQVLGFELHHQPTQGGTAQQTHFRQRYQRTLDLYAAHFAEAPPATLWPAVAQRFRDGNDLVRINRQRNWLIRKPPIRWQMAALLLSTTLLVACTPQDGESPLWFWVKVGVGVWGAYIIGKAIHGALGGTRGGGRGGSGCSGGGCSGCGGCGGD